MYKHKSIKLSQLQFIQNLSAAFLCQNSAELQLRIGIFQVGERAPINIQHVFVDEVTSIEISRAFARDVPVINEPKPPPFLPLLKRKYLVQVNSPAPVPDGFVVAALPQQLPHHQLRVTGNPPVVTAAADW